MPILNDEINSYSLIYKPTKEQTIEELNQNNITDFIFLNDLLAVIYVDKDFDESVLENINQVVWWEKDYPMSSLIEITDNLSQGESATEVIGITSIANNLYERLTGKGVVIGIIDSGINYLDKSFINEDGTSKISYIWDQESNLKPPPEGISFGAEFSQEDINQAIANNDDSLTKDETGTGTAAASIITSPQNEKYRGIAPNVNLIVVKLRSYHSLYKEGRINYKSTDFLVAIYYVLEKVDELSKPAVLNFTLGTLSGDKVLYTMLNTSERLYKSGIVMVSGAGNEGNTDIHFSDTLGKNDTRDFTFQVEDDINLDIIIDSEPPDKLGVAIISPLGEISNTIFYSPEYRTYTGKFNLENVDYSVYYAYPWMSVGGAHIEISLKNVSSGVWTLRVISEDIINGNFDAYLPNKNLISEGTRFIDSDSTGTITRYALMNEVITVGGYNTKTNSIWIGSSKGSEITKFTEPDILAPGVDIISSYLNNQFTTVTGTGVSSSIVSGVVALITEFIISQTKFYKLSIFSEPIKTYLMLGATQKPIYTYPNISYGYGILNYQNTLNIISQTL